jgi:hypothetical protein
VRNLLDGKLPPAPVEDKKKPAAAVTTAQR